MVITTNQNVSAETVLSHLRNMENVSYFLGKMCNIKHSFQAYLLTFFNHLLYFLIIFRLFMISRMLGDPIAWDMHSPRISSRILPWVIFIHEINVVKGLIIEIAVIHQRRSKQPIGCIWWTNQTIIIKCLLLLKDVNCKN